MSKDKFSFNFWPSFTDLMLSLVLIVLCILGVFAFKTGLGEADIKKAQNSQDSINEQLKDTVGSSNVAVIKTWNEIQKHRDKEVIVLAELNKQTISFSDKVLFNTDQSELLPRGIEVLNKIGPVIYNNLNNIKEIRIEGHTDNDDTAEYNLRLGARRAIAVYNHITFRDNDNPGRISDYYWKINPAEHLISISSYGKFKPVGRTPGMKYNHTMLEQANVGRLQAGNRRIEIILEYKYGK